MEDWGSWSDGTKAASQTPGRKPSKQLSNTSKESRASTATLRHKPDAKDDLGAHNDQAIVQRLAGVQPGRDNPTNLSAPEHTHRMDKGVEQQAASTQPGSAKSTSMAAPGVTQAVPAAVPKPAVPPRTSLVRPAFSAQRSSKPPGGKFAIKLRPDPVENTSESNVTATKPPPVGKPVQQLAQSAASADAPAVPVTAGIQSPAPFQPADAASRPRAGPRQQTSKPTAPADVTVAAPQAPSAQGREQAAAVVTPTAGSAAISSVLPKARPAVPSAKAAVALTKPGVGMPPPQAVTQPAPSMPMQPPAAPVSAKEGLAVSPHQPHLATAKTAAATSATHIASAPPKQSSRAALPNQMQTSNHAAPASASDAPAVSKKPRGAAHTKAEGSVTAATAIAQTSVPNQAAAQATPTAGALNVNSDTAALFMPKPRQLQTPAQTLTQTSVSPATDLLMKAPAKPLTEPQIKSPPSLLSQPPLLKAPSEPFPQQRSAQKMPIATFRVHTDSKASNIPFAVSSDASRDDANDEDDDFFGAAGIPTGIKQVSSFLHARQAIDVLSATLPGSVSYCGTWLSYVACKVVQKAACCFQHIPC